jgi:hypothetical protein
MASEVAAVWIEGSELLGQFQNNIVLHGKDRSKHDIRSYHGCYDALSYPLFFPSDELGWHMDIPKKGVIMEDVNTAHALLRLIVVLKKKKKKPVCLSSYTFHVYQTIIPGTPLIP